jgi:hypothetical protein
VAHNGTNGSLESGQVFSREEREAHTQGLVIIIITIIAVVVECKEPEQ